ncbi:homocysteine S-methyltransferase [Nocardioides sp.]|uniref:homocysteine S-methyltransferase n=1 Tax=Nocardioides sp. TaxID=35761 RepID=UPI00352847F2
MSTGSLVAALAERVVVLDGGLASRLEEHGHDLSDELWSARLLVDDPAEVRAAHRDYAAAGAEVATTASYQVSYDALAARGVDREGVDELLRRSVALAREASDGASWVAASVGPYGAALAGGQEYTGDYDLDVSGLRRWHRRRLQVLAEAGPDALALETIPSLAEVEALLAEVEGLGVPCWLSLTAVGDRTRRDEPVAEAFAMAAEAPEVVAAGVNCCTADSADAALALAAVFPGVVYPNSGEEWDPVGRRWAGAATFTVDRVRGWVDHGARLVGGCCRVGPDRIAEVSSIVRGL